jgi:hypothetical protein
MILKQGSVRQHTFNAAKSGVVQSVVKGFGTPALYGPRELRYQRSEYIVAMLITQIVTVLSLSTSSKPKRAPGA